MKTSTSYQTVFNKLMDQDDWQAPLDSITLTPSRETHVSARCPQCHAYAELFTSGKYAGIWACTNSDCMASDDCEHLTIHPERFTILTESDKEDVVLNICNVCNQAVKEDN